MSDSYPEFARQLIVDQAALQEHEARLRLAHVEPEDSSLVAFGLPVPVPKGSSPSLDMRRSKLAERKMIRDEKVRKAIQNGYRLDGKTWTRRPAER